MKRTIQNKLSENSEQRKEQRGTNPAKNSEQEKEQAKQIVQKILSSRNNSFLIRKICSFTKLVDTLFYKF